jgi:hypothetical protein
MAEVEQLTAPELVEEAPAPEGTEDGTVEGRIADLEQRIEEGRPLVDQEEPEDAVQEPAAEEVDAPERAGDGEEVGEEEPEEPAEEEVSSEGGEEEPEEEADAEEDVLEDEGEIFLASIPGRRENDPDIELEIAGLKPEEQEGLNRLRNGYMRGEDYRAQIAKHNELRTDVETVAREMSINPIGYINHSLEDADKVALAKFLLTQDSVYDAVAPVMGEWEHDTARREGEAAKIERDILKKSEKARKAQAADEAAREEGDKIVDHLEGLAEALSQQQLSRFMRFSLGDLREFVANNPKKPLSLETVNDVLTQSGIFETFGVKPSLPDPQERSHPSKARPQRSAKARSKVDEAPSKDDFKKRRARKRKSASAPPGSGAPPVANPFKKGDSVEDRIAFIEKHGIPKT